MKKYRAEMKLESIRLFYEWRKTCRGSEARPGMGNEALRIPKLLSILSFHGEMQSVIAIAPIFDERDIREGSDPGSGHAVILL